jgi:hypothetical protein
MGQQSLVVLATSSLKPRTSRRHETVLAAQSGTGMCWAATAEGVTVTEVGLTGGSRHRRPSERSWSCFVSECRQFVERYRAGLSGAPGGVCAVLCVVFVEGSVLGSQV